MKPDILESFKKIYLVEMINSTEREFIAMLGGRFLDKSEDAGPGRVLFVVPSITTPPHRFEVPEDSVAKSVFLGSRSKITNEKASGVVCVRGYLELFPEAANKEVCDFLGESGRPVRPTLVSTVRATLRNPASIVAKAGRLEN
jgi:hypothetical protein